jgi:hypothetical protein
MSAVYKLPMILQLGKCAMHQIPCFDLTRIFLNPLSLAKIYFRLGMNIVLSSHLKGLNMKDSETKTDA